MGSKWGAGTRANAIGQEFAIPLDDFLNRVSVGSSIRRMLRDTDTIIAASEVAGLCSSAVAKKPVVRLGRVPEAELFDMLRCAKDNMGKEVWARANFSMEKARVPPTHGVQSFVSAKTLAAIPARNAFVRSLGAKAGNTKNSYVITYSGEEGRYAAILVPPFVTYLPKENFGIPMENLRRIVDSGGRIFIRGLAGDVEFNVAGMLRAAEAELARPSDTVAWVKDGTHRAYVCYLAGIPVNAITVRNGEETPTSAPIRFQDMVVALERPQNPEHRYPGLHNTGRVDLRKIGIDP